MKALELVGSRFNRLLVLKRVDEKKSHSRWLCRCDCGKEKVVYGIALTRGGTKSCGCLFKELRSERSKQFVKDLIGIRFEKLIVISRNLEHQKSLRSNSAYWNCKCDCGGVRVACGSNLIRGITKSCGCYRKERMVKVNQEKALAPGEAGFNELFVHYKYNARKRDLSFELSKDQFRELVAGNCYYCGTKPTNRIKNTTGDFIYSGIDRLDSKMGYSLGNCVSCCFVCNKAKLNLNVIEFLDLVKRVYRHRVDQQEFFK